MKKGELPHLLEKLQFDINRLYHIATHDEKTGLYNHVFFKDVANMEIAEAKRGKPLSLIAVDIDFFKKINDTYGHLQADVILQKLAHLLEQEVRKYDIVSRFGGEEFFILLPDTNEKTAKKVAERIRKNTEKNLYMKKYSVTISLGVTQFKQRDNLERMSKRCDKALYAAKKAGRNCVKLG